MRISRLSIIVLSLLLPLSIHAQKPKKKVVKKPAVAVAPEPVEDPRITEMRELTQQVIFIDSIVVDKSDFLSNIRINTESGSLTTFDNFFQTKGHPYGYVFLNEMGNKCYFSDRNEDGQMQLYTSDKLGHDWSEPMALKGLSDGITAANYPFMLTDGTTFYFSAKGQESIGGYDIFVTRYDAEDGQFLKPENIGMPFNSEANDYMYAIDEISNIGYFVTDRRQPDDKVCIYIFIPPTTRKTYAANGCPTELLRGYADISSIAKTWGDGNERAAALERLKSVNTAASSNAPKAASKFVINDQVTYTSASQFRCPDGPSLYRELTDASKRLAETTSSLESLRTLYAKARKEERMLLQSEILDAEQQQERLFTEVKSLEKRLRNEENKIINP